MPFLSNTGPTTSLVTHGQKRLLVMVHIKPLLHVVFLFPSYLRVFFFIAGTISVVMSTLRSNLRLKHSLLGSCRGNRHTVSLHRWCCSSAAPPRAGAEHVLSAEPQGGSSSLRCPTRAQSSLGVVNMFSAFQRIKGASPSLMKSHTSTITEQWFHGGTLLRFTLQPMCPCDYSRQCVVSGSSFSPTSTPLFYAPCNTVTHKLSNPT